MPSEGGNVDWAPQTIEDFQLLEFARKYAENSNHAENRKGAISKVSVERVCSGPAIPLLY